jgi:hypothetical protein
MDELLTLARQLRRPHSTDHGLVRRLASQVADFADARASSALHTSRDVPTLSTRAARDLPRHAESLSNPPATPAPSRVDVDSRSSAHVLRSRRRHGFAAGARARNGARGPPGGSALGHARARAARRRTLTSSRLPEPTHDRADNGSDMRILIADDHGIVRAA